jgi:hypothetical protein
VAVVAVATVVGVAGRSKPTAQSQWRKKTRSTVDLAKKWKKKTGRK